MAATLICYDIADPKRLGRVFRYLKKRAMPLQYSVFLFSGDDRQLERCLAGAAALIDEKHDDLRAYPLPARGFKARLGKAALPEGIQWSELPAAW
jgi:CRISPR-associated protein Cas2